MQDYSYFALFQLVAFFALIESAILALVPTHQHRQMNP
jgi:cell division protein FtsL